MKTYCAFRLPALTALAVLVVAACSPGHGEDDGHDHGDDPAADHAEEEHVELTEKQFRSAGIEVAAAAPGMVFEALTLPGTVATNSDAVLHVTPRVSGQAQSVFKHLGESVTVGELLCVIDSVELGGAIAEYLRDRARARAAEETLARERELYEGRLVAMTRMLDGAIAVQERIHRREEELQEKAVSTVRPLLEAEKALQLARLEKDKQLTEFMAERDTRLLELDVEVRARTIDLTAAAHHLQALGVSAEELAGLTDSSPLLSGQYRVHAPGSGIVVDRHVSIGEFVEAGAKLFIIENLSSVWFVASAFEEQLQFVRTGQTAHVSLNAFPGTTLRGQVSFLDYHVDPTSRSVGVRITLDNEQLASWPEQLPLRPGMFGRVQLETAARHAAVVLPEQALVHADRGDYVFVQVEPFGFEHRDVEVKHVAGDKVEVISGLEPGEMVAITGTFLLKSVELQSELGGGHSH